jgi:hypothetical protein
LIERPAFRHNRIDAGYGLSPEVATPHAGACVDNDGNSASLGISRVERQLLSQERPRKRKCQKRQASAGSGERPRAKTQPAGQGRTEE